MKTVASKTVSGKKPDAKAERKSRKAAIVFDLILIAIIVIASSIIVYFRLMIQYLPNHGPGFDSYALLSNALTMAGKSTYYEIGRPPVQPFLLSLFFRMGFVSELVAYMVDAVFYGLGAIGLYLLSRRRMSPLLSLTTAFIFMSFPDMILNLTLGATDIMAISLSIWAIYFAVLGGEKNSRFFIPVFPLFILAFLTRYTAGVMLFPIIFYLSKQGSVLRYMKVYAQSISLAALILFIDISYYWRITRGQALFQFLGPLSVATTVERTPSRIVTGATPPKAFFVTNFPDFISISTLGWIITGLFIVGLLILAISLIKIRTRSIPISVTIIVGSFGLVAFLTFSSINFLLANIVIVILFIFGLTHFFKFEKKHLVDALIFIWFVSFLCYHSHQLVKESRYFITMAPQTAYFAALGLGILTEWLKKIKPKLIYQFATGILALSVIAFSVFSTYESYNKVKNIGGWGIPEAVEEVCDWIRPKLDEDSVVYADYFVAVAWYLKKPVVAMPIFKDERAYTHELEKYKPDYFISIWQSGETYSYKVVKEVDQVKIFAPKDVPPREKPKMFIVGQDIDHYLEELLDFDYYIFRKKSPFPDDTAWALGNTYLDEYTVRELSKYPVLVLYNFKWQNIEKAENVVRDYVKQGGTVVIDASGNSGKSAYDLNNGSFVGTSIVKKTLPRNASIWISSEHNLTQDVNSNKFGPFIDEFGNPWQGSTYQKVEYPDIPPIKDMAKADKKTLVGVQKYGKGKIVWIGFNLIFHAFYYENEDETQFINNLFEYSFDDSK